MIAGAPGTGKRTLATRMGELLRLEPLHADDLLADLDWSSSSAALARLMVELSGPYVISGCSAVRAARKTLALTTKRPFDVLIVLSHPWVELTKGQAAMGKGIFTVLEEIRPELRARGVEIADGDAALAEIMRTSEAAQ